MTNTFLKNCSVAKYQIFREEEEDCLGISNSRILLSSLSNFLRRPNKAEVMVVKAILTKRVKLTRTTLAAANPPSSQWQPPSASIITVFFQPNKKYLGKKEKSNLQIMDHLLHSDIF